MNVTDALTPLCPLIIGAPFGNYLRWPGTTRTLGTYTWEYRAGFWGRLWRVLKTVRYHHRTRSWVNRLGLPNPGLRHLKASPEVCNCVLSVHGFDEAEWLKLAAWASDALHPLALEFNLSCPNVRQEVGVCKSIQKAVDVAIRDGLYVIAKLPPVRWMGLAEPLYAMGVRCFHLCNTIPTPGGGLSGKPLKQFSLWAIEEFRQRWDRSVILIGGGGVSCVADAMEYVRAGADHVAVASMLFNPFRWREVGRVRDALAAQSMSPVGVNP